MRKSWYWVLLPFVLVVASIGILVLGYGLTRSTPRPGSPTTTITHQVDGTPASRRGTTPAIIPSPTPRQVPVSVVGEHLVIPSIGVNAPVESVGIDSSDNTLAVPTQNPWMGVGWYNLGPVPGARGSAVIDGHLDRPGGSPAVFWNLKLLHVGDSILVTEVGGKTLHFRVTALAYYTPASAPTSAIFGNTSGTYLNLITCAGTWIPSIRQTTQRLVVYTTLV